MTDVWDNHQSHPQGRTWQFGGHRCRLYDNIKIVLKFIMRDKARSFYLAQDGENITQPDISDSLRRYSTSSFSKNCSAERPVIIFD